MANDSTSNHTDYSDPGKAWEYDLYKADKSPALYDIDAARETQKLLWQPGDFVSTTDFSAGSLSGAIDDIIGSLSGSIDDINGSLSGLTDLSMDSLSGSDVLMDAGQEYETAAASTYGQNTVRASWNAGTGTASSRGGTSSRGAGASRGGTSSRSATASSRTGSRGASAPRKSLVGGLFRSVFLLSFLIILISAAATSLTHRSLRYWIHYITHSIDLPDDILGGGSDEDTDDDTGDDTGTDDSDDHINSYPDGQILTEFGYDYSDFYSPKYIASYGDEMIDTSDHKYQELCVIDSEPIIGTGHDPINPQNNWWMNSEPTSHTLCSFDVNNLIFYGFTVKYADRKEQNPFCLPEILEPPATADKDAFRERVTEVYVKDAENYNPGFSVLELSEMKEIAIDDHNITYTVITGEDKEGSGVVDVLSIEEKPLGSAFITEYRYKDGEFADPGEALRTLYGMLDFRREDLEYTSASNCRFSVSRVYNGDNSCAAKIDLSRLSAVRSSVMTQKNRVDFELGTYGKYDRPTTSIRCEYLDYRDVDNYGGPEQWAAEMLEQIRSKGEYPTEITGENLQKLRVFRCDVYHLTLEGVEERDGAKENIANHMCRIETPEGGEIIFDVEFVHDIPEDLNMEQFLRKYVKLESGN